MGRPPPTFGALLLGIRLRAGMTQLALARRAGISVRAVRDIEQGRVLRPRAPSVTQLVTALSPSAADRRALLEFAGAPHPAGRRTGRPARDPCPGQPHVEILGPITVGHDDVPVDLDSDPLRHVLGILALHHSRVVAHDEIIAVLWGEQPPESARRLVCAYVRRLRTVLEPDPPEPGRLGVMTASRAGFRLTLDGEHLDLLRFDELVADARRAYRAGQTVRARGLYAEALACWRGRVLADADPRLQQHPAAAAARQRHLAALLAFADLSIGQGEHAEALAGLREPFADEPWHEGLGARLMLALTGDGQQAEALAVYHGLRSRLAEELGLAPGPELQEAYLRVLRQEVPPARRRDAPRTPVRAPTSGVPAQLPAVGVPFVGRERELRSLDNLRQHAGTPGAPNIAMITGSAGVGKTALAVRWAQTVRHAFPDGQLYVNLHGYAATPALRPIQALARFLRALGVPAGQIPSDQAEAADLYRSLVADRRVLVVLDNARSADQVRPLLPGGTGCFVMITSQERMAGLVAREGARRLEVDVLDPDEAGALLGALLDGRTDVQPWAVTELAACCARLPLAMRIAAANLRQQPDGMTVAGYVAELRHGNRLAALASDGDDLATVRAAFDLSYAALAPSPRRMFRLMGVMPGPEATAGAAAALAGCRLAVAASLLDDLSAAHMIDQLAPGRYGCHDLLRLYALDRARRDDPESERRAALARLHRWYLHRVEAAARVLYPEKARLPAKACGDGDPPAPFAGTVEATAWLEDERPNLLAVVGHAAENGAGDVAWLLADGLRGYFFLRRNTVDWLTATEAGLAAAIAAADVAGQASAHLSLAAIHRCEGRYRPAVAEYAEAGRLARECGWVDGESTAVGNLASTYWQLGDLPAAADQFTYAISLCRRTGWLAGEATAVGNLGALYLQQGWLHRAAAQYRAALDLTRRIRSRPAEAINLANLGEVYHGLGRLEPARAHLTLALAMHREVGGRGAEVEATRLLAAVCGEAGETREARELAARALGLAREVGDRHGEADALNTLGEVHQRGEEWAPAAQCHAQALSLARAIESRYPQVVALLGEAATTARQHGAAAAMAAAGQALTLARNGGFAILQGQAHTALAILHLAGRDPGQAVAEGFAALTVLDGTGHRTATARAHLVLAEALHRAGQTESARRHHRTGLGLFARAGVPRDSVASLKRAMAWRAPEQTAIPAAGDQPQGQSRAGPRPRRARAGQ
jgi:DNA-binding SARP family transcriptional activator/tetratricopeptide (TPR) repeat protein